MKRPILVCFGTRPEVVKLAPVIHGLRRHDISPLIVTTGQHREMLDQMLSAFDLQPDADLRLMTAGQKVSELTGKAIVALSAEVERLAPGMMIVQGDTTTAFCGALAAFYNGVPVAHVEAGLRTGNATDPFPEEVHRRLIAQLARWHFVPSEAARDNLLREGCDPARVAVTGNTVIDAAQCMASRHPRLALARDAGRRRVLVTMHRRETHGQPQRDISRMLARLAERGDIEILFPVHLSPAVRASVFPELADHENVRLVAPLSYEQFIAELASADLVLTDSGGVQEEAPAFNVPVLVMRETTERPEGVQAGCALLCGTDPEIIFQTAERVLDDRVLHERMATAKNPYGDGSAAERIVSRLMADWREGLV